MIGVRSLRNLGLWILSGIALTGLTALAGINGFVVLIGLVFATLVFLKPVVGLVSVILTGTCFQIIGSAHITGLPLSLPKLTGIITLGSWFLHLLKDRVGISYSPQLPALASFSGVVILSAMIMPDTYWSGIGLYKFLQLFLMYFLIANLGGENWRQLMIACGALTAGLTISAIIGLVEYAVPAFSIESDDPRIIQGTLGAVLDRDSLESGEIIKRVTGGLADANWFSYTLAAVLPLNLFWWRLTNRSWIRLLILSCASLQILGLLFSFTRTALFGFSVQVLYLLGRRRLPFWWTTAVGVSGLIVAVVLMPPTFSGRIFSMKYLKEGSTPLRSDLASAAWYLIKEKPLFGHGYAQYGDQLIKRLMTDPKMQLGDWGAALQLDVDLGKEEPHNIGTHSLYLEVLVEYGLLGFLPFVMLLWFVISDLRLCEASGNPMQQELATCLLAGFLSLVACGIVGHIKILKILWILSGLAVALRRNTFETYPKTEAVISTGKGPASVG